ncbi:MAG: HlyD family efflux transporter periplasmic adaptor subunit [Spirochaetes bacterium]|nr:MAG: HlyD family efflux transporter periplasmic adaptor subunit [Spirochaetota bacterium]
MKKHKKLILYAAGGLVVLVVVIRLVAGNGATRVKPRTGPIVEAIYALGTVKSDSVYTLKMGIPATIRRLSVSEGQPVAKGMQLAVTESGAAFFAPFAGTVTRLHCEEGEVVITGQPVLTMMDLGRTYIQVSLDQNAALRVRRGQKAELSVETMRGARLSGTVESIYPSGGQFLARIGVAKMPAEVLPDMTADVAIEVARRDEALMIPVIAVKDGVVALRREGKAASATPALGAIDGAWAEVTDGSVKASDEIVMPRE